jgi:hypothetical protein
VCLHIKAFKPTLEKAGGKAEDVKNWCIGCWNSTHPTNLYDRSTFHAHKEGTTNTRARSVKVVREKKPKAPKVFCPKKKAKKSPAKKEEGDGGEASGEKKVSRPCKRVKTREDGTTYECGTAAQKDGLCCKCFKELRPNEFHRKRCQHVEGETTCPKGGNYFGFCSSHLKHHYPECDVCKTHHPLNEHTVLPAGRTSSPVPTNNRGCPDEVEEDDEEETPEEETPEEEEETPEEETPEEEEEDEEDDEVAPQPEPEVETEEEEMARLSNWIEKYIKTHKRGDVNEEYRTNSTRFKALCDNRNIRPKAPPKNSTLGRLEQRLMNEEPEVVVVAPQTEVVAPQPEVVAPQPEKKKRVLTEEQKQRKNEQERARRAAKKAQNQQ